MPMNPMVGINPMDNMQPGGMDIWQLLQSLMPKNDPAMQFYTRPRPPPEASYGPLGGSNKLYPTEQVPQDPNWDVNNNPGMVVPGKPFRTNDGTAGAPPIGGEAPIDSAPEAQPGWAEPPTYGPNRGLPQTPVFTPGPTYNSPDRGPIVGPVVPQAPAPAPVLPGGAGRDTLGTGGASPMSGLAQALGALQVPPPPEAPRVATPPPPNKPNIEMGNVLKLLLASGGGSQQTIPPMAALFGR